MKSKVRFVSMVMIASGLWIAGMFLTNRAGATSAKRTPRLGMIRKQIGLVPKEAGASAYLGRLGAAEQVRLLISFDVRDHEGLSTLLGNLYDPASPAFHRWLTAKQFGKRFGRSREEFDMVSNWLESRGFNVDRRYSNRLAIGFSGTPDVIERAFSVQMARYWDSQTGSAFYSNSQEPTLPREIAAFTAGLVGLNNLVAYHRPVHVFGPAGGDNTGHAGGGQTIRPDGTLNGHTFLGPSDLAAVYNYQSLQNSGIKGQGQSVGVIMDSDVKDSDIAAFRTQFGLPAANL